MLNSKNEGQRRPASLRKKPVRPLQTHLVIQQRQKRKNRRTAPLRQEGKRIVLAAVAVLALVLVAGTLALAWLYAGLTQDLPSLAQLPLLLDPQHGTLLRPTVLYDRTGQHEIYTLENPGITRRYLRLDPVAPDHVSPLLITATVALHDPTFWSNPGFAWWNPLRLEPLTLAEKLADDLLLENEPAGLRRALRMRLLAAQLVSTYGRSQVLEWYLNSAYYGHLAYGAESAAQLYLGKSAAELNLGEAVLLATTDAAPALNPFDAPAAALERQQEGLSRLLAQGIITEAQYQSLSHSLPSLNAAPQPAPEIAAAFTRLALDQLEERFGRKHIERGGLKIITTLDYDLQLQLACTLRSQLEHLTGQSPSGEACEAARLLPSLPPGSEPLSPELAASGILLDPQSGQVLAFVGDTTLSGENERLSGHQPGSLLTPFVALAAFARGLGPASLVWDIPASLPQELAAYQNPDSEYHGPMRLRIALGNDYLVPLAQTLMQIGPANVWRLAEPLGLAPPGPDSDPAKLLFAGGSTTLVEMAQAYSTFANLGTQVGQPATSGPGLQPLTVQSVTDWAGTPWLEQPPAQTRSVISPQLAYLVHHVLADESARWRSLGYPNPLEIGRPAAAKIGQTADHQQVWTAGYTAQYLAVVWLGLPSTDSGENTLNPRWAAGIWHALIQYLSRDLPSRSWAMPAGITTLEVCDPSGKLPTADCPSRVSEVFLSGNEPTEPDNLYQVVAINRETGMLATVFTPLELVEEKTFLIAPAEAQDWARAAGLPLPPTGYDTIQAPVQLPEVNITAPAFFGHVSGTVTLRGSANGENFSSYSVQAGQGLNPRTWMQITEESQTPVSGGVLGVWDTTRESDGLYALRLTVLRQDRQVDTAIIQVTVDNTPPTASITYPAPEQRFSLAQAGETINFQAEASDAAGLERLEWILDGQSLVKRARRLTCSPGSLWRVSTNWWCELTTWLVT